MNIATQQLWTQRRVGDFWILYRLTRTQAHEGVLLQVIESSLEPSDFASLHSGNEHRLISWREARQRTGGRVLGEWESEEALKTKENKKWNE